MCEQNTIFRCKKFLFPPFFGCLCRKLNTPGITELVTFLAASQRQNLVHKNCLLNSSTTHFCWEEVIWWTKSRQRQKSNCRHCRDKNGVLMTGGEGYCRKKLILFRMKSYFRDLGPRESPSKQEKENVQRRTGGRIDDRMMDGLHDRSIICFSLLMRKNSIMHQKGWGDTVPCNLPLFLRQI